MDTPKASPIDVSNIHLEPLNSIEDLHNTVCRSLYRYWQGLSGSESFQSDDLVEVPDAVPYLLLIDVDETDATFRVRMEGAQLASVSSRDFTGKTLETLGQETPLTFKFCQAILANKAPVFTRDSFEDEHKGMIYFFEETVALPVLNAEGALMHILLVHGPRH